MKFNLKTRPETLTTYDNWVKKTNPHGWVNPEKAANWFEAFEKELREHYEEYKKLAKPPECDETWYCIQYLELLVEEILGDVEEAEG